ncbi:MAG: hypothetical protein QHH01_01805 [Spirochaetales bacterium]|nr:hypothetical protein [Spirochaetales bacterium]
MNARGFWIFAIAACMLLAMLVAQTVRYTELRMEVRHLEAKELDLIKQGKELDATIARYGNTEAIDTAAAHSNLKIAEPERFIVIMPGEESKDQKQGSKAQPGGGQ